MKMLANFVSINGLMYVLPGHLTDKDVSALCAMLLLLRPLDSVYSSDYKSEFHYQMLDYVPVRLGSRSIYVSEEAARSARDARNAEIEAAKTGTDDRARAEDLYYSKP
jgi:hypothetical protein